MTATVTSIAEAASRAAAMDEDEQDLSRAEQMEVHAQLLLTNMTPFYRLLIDDKGVSTLAEINGTSVLKPMSKEVAIEKRLVRMLGNRVTVSDIRNEVYPRWCSEMRNGHMGVLALNFDTVKPFAFKSERLPPNVWTWQRLPFDPVENAERPPELAELMKRTSPDEANAVEMFIGSLFDYESTRHQYLYLHGVGNDGKSMLKDAIQLMFAEQGIAIMDGDDLTGDKHASSDLEGKRLLLFPDLRKPSLPSSGIFKKITGDDTIGVNPKGMPRHNIKLCAKVIILSNDAPQLEGNRADERRLISAHFETFEGGEDTVFKAKFLKAAPAIAQYCYSKYCSWKRGNPGKGLPQAAAALADAMSDSTAARASDVAEQLFKVTELNASFTLAHEVDKIIAGASGKDYGMLVQLRKWLKNSKVKKTDNAPRKYLGLQCLPAAERFKSQFAD